MCRGEDPQEKKKKKSSQSLHSMFSLSVQYSICLSILPKPLNQLSHTCELNAHRIIHHTEIPRRVKRPGLAKAAPLDDASHQHHQQQQQQLRGCERKPRLIPNWSKQMLKKLTADNAEISFLSGRNPFFLSNTNGTIIHQGCTMRALSAGVNSEWESIREEVVAVRGSDEKNNK